VHQELDPFSEFLCLKHRYVNDSFITHRAKDLHVSVAHFVYFFTMEFSCLIIMSGAFDVIRPLYMRNEPKNEVDDVEKGKRRSI
jgi:hypothetical protein